MLKAGNTLECALSWALDCDPKFMQIGQPGHHAIVVLYPLCFPRIDDGYTSRFVHRLMQTASAHEWQANHALAINCAQHARLFFSSVDLGLDTAIPGTFTLTPSAAMRDALARDYAAMSGMVFGEIPALDAVLANGERFEQIVNDTTTSAPLAHEEQRE